MIRRRKQLLFHKKIGGVDTKKADYAARELKFVIVAYVKTGIGLF